MRHQARMGGRRTLLASLLRWAGFALSVAAGLLAGWFLFLAPAPTGDPAPAITPAAIEAALQPQPRPTLPVPTQGAPSRLLGDAVRVGAPAPTFALAALDGNRLTLADYRGSVVLINFWTTWCPPCRTEMPALQKVFGQYQDQGFVVLAVNVTEMDDRAEVAPFVEELGLTFPILLDEESRVSEDLYHILGLPTSVFIGRDGVVRDIYIGALDLENLERKIANLLGEAT